MVRQGCGPRCRIHRPDRRERNLGKIFLGAAQVSGDLRRGLHQLRDRVFGDWSRRPGVRGEDPVGPTLASGDLPRLREQVAGEAVNLGTTGLQSLFDPTVDEPQRFLVPPVPDNCVHREETGKGRHDVYRVARQVQHRHTVLEQTPGKLRQAPFTPPGCCRAAGTHPGSGCVLVDDDCDDLAPLRSPLEGGIVGKAEIVTEPDERHGGSVGHRVSPPGRQWSIILLTKLA